MRLLSNVLIALGLLLGVAGCEPANSRQDVPFVLQFTASWCGPCQRDAPKVEALALLVKVVKVDIDLRPEVQQQFHVTSVPTYIIMYRGEEVARTGDIDKVIEFFKGLRRK